MQQALLQEFARHAVSLIERSSELPAAADLVVTPISTAPKAQNEHVFMERQSGPCSGELRASAEHHPQLGVSTRSGRLIPEPASGVPEFPEHDFTAGFVPLRALDEGSRMASV